jgi:hypothetical protein
MPKNQSMYIVRIYKLNVMFFVKKCCKKLSSNGMIDSATLDSEIAAFRVLVAPGFANRCR